MFVRSRSPAATTARERCARAKSGFARCRALPALMTSTAVPCACRRTGYFLFRQKVPKNHCARHAGFGNVQLPKRPCAAYAKRAGANSDIHVVEHSRLAPAWRIAAQAACNGAFSLRHRASMPCVLEFGTSGAITREGAGQDGRLEASLSAPLHDAAVRGRMAEQAPNV